MQSFTTNYARDGNEINNASLHCKMQKCVTGNVNSVYKNVFQLLSKSKVIKLRKYMCGRTTLVSMK